MGELKTVEDARKPVARCRGRKYILSLTLTLFLAEIIVTKGRPVRETLGVVYPLVLQKDVSLRLFPYIGLACPPKKKQLKKNPKQTKPPDSSVA